MKTFNCGHCGGRHTSLEQVKACSQGNNTQVADTTVRDRVVTSSCSRWEEVDGKWVKHTHRWNGLLSEVVSNNNRCPDHRG